MTRERAIEVLKRMKTCMECVADWTCKECDEAFEMAIKALKLTQIGLLKDCESCRAELSCTDAIGRQAVKEQMIKYGFHAPDMTVTEFVEGLPSVVTEKAKTDWNYGEIKELMNNYHPAVLNNYLESED